MKMITQLFISVLLITSMGTLFSAVGPDGKMEISPTTCCAGNVTGSCTCIVPPAEVGDQVPFDMAGVPVEALGDISAEKSGKIPVPLVNKKQLVTFVPQSDTLFKGQEIKLLFTSFDVNKLPEGSSDSVKNNAIRMKRTMGEGVKTMTTAYRQLPGEELWTELGTTGSSIADLSQAAPIDYTIKPNGVFVVKMQYISAATGKLVTDTLSANLGAIG